MFDLHGPLPKIANALATLFAPHVEAVVHDLRTNRIVHIAGNFSRRRVGDPSLGEIGDLHPFQSDLIGPYAKANRDGRALRSISVVLRDEAGSPAWLLCINLDVSAIEGARAALDALLTMPAAATLPQAEALFPSDWREAVNAAARDVLAERQATITSLDAQAQTDLVAAIDARGLFAVRGAANYVADLLNCSRATLYKRLAIARAKGENPA